MTIERILGTDTGKEAFYKADRNFVALEKRPILNKAAAYTVVADDLNKTITVTGETTITLTAIATLGLGFRCRISNIGTGIISVVPSGTDTIATGTGITVYPGKCVEVVADYAGMWTVVGFDFTEVVNSLGAQINSLATKVIAESGSNANGRYVKFEDGTMICFGSLNTTGDISVQQTNLYRSTNYNLACPATFISTPYVVTDFDNNLNTEVKLSTIYKRTTTDVGIFAVAGKSYTAIPIILNYIAIGRWKA